jgi:riboflavin synthase alpha subunit
MTTAGTRPKIDGSVTAINGTTLTVQEEANEGGTVYTVDASGVSSGISGIAVGDKVFVDGTVNGSNVAATNVFKGGSGGHRGMRGHGGPHMDGNITAINGATITVKEEADEGGTVYTVDASKAAFLKNGAASQLSALAIGDKVFLEGTASANNVAATRIMSGNPGHKPQGK